MNIIPKSAISPDLSLYPNLTDNTVKTLLNLRNPELFSWDLISLLLIVLYIYVNEWSKGNKAVILGGAAFWGMDLFNEIWNGLFLHFTKTAPVWGAPGNDSGFIIFAGLNIEISIMFAVLGICSVKLLPKDKDIKYFGINNRIFLACFGSLTAVIIEVILNKLGALTWEWKYWNPGFPYLIFLFGYLPFFAAAYFVHDLDSIKKQVYAVSGIFTIDIIAIIIFGGFLNWL